MEPISRRSFIGRSSAVVAAAGIAAVAPTTIANAATKSSGTRSALAATEALGVGGVAAANEPIVAYVSDVRTGEISIFTGETEIVLHDRALVAKLAHAKGGK